MNENFKPEVPEAELAWSLLSVLLEVLEVKGDGAVAAEAADTDLVVLALSTLLLLCRFPSSNGSEALESAREVRIPESRDTRCLALMSRGSDLRSCFTRSDLDGGALI